MLGRDSSHMSNHTRMASEIHSILALIKYMTPVVATNCSSFQATSLFPYAPLNLRNPTGDTIKRYYSYLFQFMTVFRYWRGGIRLVVTPDNDSPIQPTSVNMQFAVDQTGLYANTTTIAGPIHGKPLVNSLGFTFHPDLTTAPIDVIIPYNSIYNCALTNVANTPNPITNSLLPYVQVVNSFVDSANNYMSFNIGAADDFRLGFQLGIPMCNSTNP